MQFTAIKASLRALKRQWPTTLVSVVGLGLGLSICLLVSLIFVQQSRIDTFHDGSERIFRVASYTDGSDRVAISPAPLAPILRQSRPEVASVTRLRFSRETALHDGNDFPLTSLDAEPQFFEVFNGFDLSHGNVVKALESPYSVVLTAQSAQRIFGSEDVIGRSLVIEDEGTFTVRGVLSEPEGDSHLQFDALFSYQTLIQNENDNQWLNQWDDDGRHYTYMILKDSESVESIESAVDEIAWTHSEKNSQDPSEDTLWLQPLASITMGPLISKDVAQGVLPSFIIYILGTLALVVLVRRQR